VAPADGNATDLEDGDETVVPLEWYEHHVAEFVPSSDKPLACFGHPKLHSVIERAVSLWLDGEKVLIFCFYRETVKALRNHLTREVDRAKQVGDVVTIVGVLSSVDSSPANFPPEPTAYLLPCGVDL
jgi:hypothetical protein